MPIETLGDAYSHGWRITVRCAWGKREGMKTIRECAYGDELDLKTLIWTRGVAFPLSGLDSRMKCPRCGSRRVRLIYSVPPNQRRAVG